MFIMPGVILDHAFNWVKKNTLNTKKTDNLNKNYDFLVYSMGTEQLYRVLFNKI